MNLNDLFVNLKPKEQNDLHIKKKKNLKCVLTYRKLDPNKKKN